MRKKEDTHSCGVSKQQSRHTVRPHPAPASSSVARSSSPSSFSFLRFDAPALAFIFAWLVLAALSARARRRGECMGDGVGDQVRWGVGGCDGMHAVHVREQIAHVAEAQLGIDYYYS